MTNKKINLYDLAKGLSLTYQQRNQEMSKQKRSPALSTHMDKHRPNTLQHLDTVLSDTAFCFPTLAVCKGFHL